MKNIIKINRRSVRTFLPKLRIGQAVEWGGNLKRVDGAVNYEVDHLGRFAEGDGHYDSHLIPLAVAHFAHFGGVGFHGFAVDRYDGGVCYGHFATSHYQAGTTPSCCAEYTVFVALANLIIHREACALFKKNTVFKHEVLCVIRACAVEVEGIACFKLVGKVGRVLSADTAHIGDGIGSRGEIARAVLEILSYAKIQILALRKILKDTHKILGCKADFLDRAFDVLQGSVGFGVSRFESDLGNKVERTRVYFFCSNNCFKQIRAVC